jgi:hypothetical protein
MEDMLLVECETQKRLDLTNLVDRNPKYCLQ